MISVVIPLYDEAEIVAELGARCVAAMQAVDEEWELVLVDDGSSDGTADRARAVEGPVVVHVLPENRGQWGATRAGLAVARGETVVVMDGDLQDPPELLPQLIQAWRGAPDAVVFAVKRSRQDALWMRIAVAI